VTAARRCSLALALLGCGLVALLLSPVGRPAPAPALVAHAAVERSEVVAEKTSTSRTHTHTHSTSSTEGSPCPPRLIEIFPSDCSPAATPAPGPTFSFTNTAGQVSIPPTATPRPAPPPTATPLDTPFPAEATGGDAATTTTGAPSTSAELPASGAGASHGGGFRVPLLAALVILVLLGGTAGLAVLRLR
jgi:hypothetical protein